MPKERSDDAFLRNDKRFMRLSWCLVLMILRCVVWCDIMPLWGVLDTIGQTACSGIGFCGRGAKELIYEASNGNNT